MGSFPAILQDTASGLGSSALGSARDAALSSTEDNASLHALIVGIAGPSTSPAKPVVGSPSDPANVPQTDTAKNATPWYKSKVVIWGAVIVGALVIFGGGAKLMK